jgi:hypothetical protein
MKSRPERTIEEKFRNAALPPKEMSQVFLDYEIRTGAFGRFCRAVPGRIPRAIFGALGAWYDTRKVARKFEIFMESCKAEQKQRLRAVLDR